MGHQHLKIEILTLVLLVHCAAPPSLVQSILQMKGPDCQAEQVIRIWRPEKQTLLQCLLERSMATSLPSSVIHSRTQGLAQPGT